MLRKAKGYLATHTVLDIALLVIITLLATRGWFNMQLPKGHDAVADMLLAQAASHTISLHNLLSGWSTDWFSGHPLFYVHPPLVNYLIWALSYPLDWILGAKMLYLSFYILSGVFAYLYVFELTKNRPASFAAGLAYVFLPYHVLEVAFEGHHGAFGLPYMLTPLIMLSLERLLQKPGIKYALINAILIALLTLTYPQVYPFLVGPFLALYVILRIWWQRQRGREYVQSAVISSAAAFCLPLLITAFWWLPLVSEVRYSAATNFPLEASREYSATFLQAITLRPNFCCAPSSAYGASGSIFTEILRMLPFVLVVLGVIMNRHNRYVWLFLALILIAMLLAMGPDSPIPLFNLIHRYVPFFSGLRTPWRFLLFSSLAYAVLIGFCVKGVSDRLGQIQPKKLRGPIVTTIVLLLTGLIVIGNTWQETRTAFSTLTLTDDQRNAFAWLKAQDKGDYRITDLPFKTWVWDTENRWVINPVYWTYLHGKETVFGAVPAVAVKYTAASLESLNTDLERGPFDMSRWLNILNVKYVLLDKTDPLSSNVILDDNFERVWTSDTMDIYENHAFKPRIFSFTTTGERPINLYNGDTFNLSYAEGTQQPMLSLSNEYCSTADLSLKSIYRFATPHDYLCLESKVDGISFTQNDAIRIVFYSEYNMPEVHLSLDLLENDGSMYDVVIGSVDGIKAGWNEVSFPISLLTLRYSSDENNQLDLHQIDRLWIGVGRQGDSCKSREFALYFDKLSIVTQETNTNVEYTRVRPGKYKVHVNSDSPYCLVLSESYHPNWVAHVDGKTVHSQLVYQALNGFYLEAGEYDVTLEFVTSPLRTAGVILSGISILCILLIATVTILRMIYLNITKRSPN